MEIFLGILPHGLPIIGYFEINGLGNLTGFGSGHNAKIENLSLEAMPYMLPSRGILLRWSPNINHVCRHALMILTQLIIFLLSVALPYRRGI